MTYIHWDYGVIDNCLSMMDTYGEICVKCNKCGRFLKDEELLAKKKRLLEHKKDLIRREKPETKDIDRILKAINEVIKRRK